MGKFDECQRPFSPCWCESRPNNPHCKSVLPSVPLDNPYFITTMIIAGMILILIKLKIIKMKTLNILFEKFYDSVSNFLSGGKSIAPNELKSF